MVTDGSQLQHSFLINKPSTELISDSLNGQLDFRLQPASIATEAQYSTPLWLKTVHESQWN